MSVNAPAPRTQPSDQQQRIYQAVAAFQRTTRAFLDSRVPTPDDVINALWQLRAALSVEKK